MREEIVKAFLREVIQGKSFDADKVATCMDKEELMTAGQLLQIGVRIINERISVMDPAAFDDGS